MLNEKPGIAAGLQRVPSNQLLLASNVQINRLGAFAAAIRFRVEAYLLILGESVQARSLYCRNMHKDVCTTIIRLDETKTLFGVEELYDASLGHAQVLFSPPVCEAGSTIICPERGVRQAVPDI